MTESLRLYFVVLALGFPDVELGISGAVFVALDRLPADRGAARARPGSGSSRPGVVGVLTVAYGVPLPEATAIALLDRVISVFSVIVLGSIALHPLAQAARRGTDRPAEAGQLGAESA